MKLPQLYLRKNEDRRVRLGHPWVFSNEVDVSKRAITDFEAGAQVDVHSHDDRWLGRGYVNPSSLICARIVTRTSGELVGEALLERRIRQALVLRERLYPMPFYRLIFGEGDGLPGLVVDRYGEVLVAQIGTAGMECLRDEILAALVSVLKPSAVVWRNDLSSRALEGLESYVQTPLGQVPDQLGIQENDCVFEIAPLTGHKTGWYFDQSANRRRLTGYVGGKRVLDAFSYSGGFGVQAAVAGASEVLCVDSSQTALDQAARNAALNRIEARIDTRRADGFDALKSMHRDGERYDVVVLDPPAFIRRKKDLKTGLEAYRRLNRLAVPLLAPGGVLLTASCSSHLKREQLMDALQGGARAANRTLQVLEEAQQGPDHPVHAAMPESAYLKVIVARLLSV